MARPVAVDAPFNQPGNGKGKSHRQPDIADIEGRRMKGEAGVLKNGVEPAPVERRALEPLKRVRGEQAKSEEASSHHRLHGQRADL